jgi:integrase
MGMGKDKKKRGPIEDGGGVYHYRRRIPDDIRAILRSLDEMPNAACTKQDKREEKKRLGRNKLRAQAAWEEYERQVEARWEQLRAGTLGGLNLVQREALAGEVYRRWLKGFPPENFHAGASAAFALATMQELDHEIPRQLLAKTTKSDSEIIDEMQGHHVDAVLAERGLILSPQHRRLVVAAAHQAAKHACRFAMQRFQGDMRSDPDAERYPAWPDPATATLVGLHHKWVLNRRPNGETRRAFLSVVNKLVAFVGYDDVTRLTTADIRRWCAALKERGEVSDRRIREHYLAAIKAILNSAVTMGYLVTNVAAPVKVDVEETEKKREQGLRDAEIYAILRATFGPFPDSPHDDVQNARRWVPWLLLYTGARVSEMTRLESRHIRREEGVDLIDIETSKTRRSRIVPIHPHLVEQGFLDFVASRRGKPLFFDRSKLGDDRSLTIHRTRAEGVADWIRTLDVMRIQRPVDIRSRVAPNHGFRHRWRTEARRLFMDREVRNYLQGHQIENVGEGYGDVPVGVSAPWIEMFPRFDVSGEELVVHRQFDLGLLMQAASRRAEMSALKVVGDGPSLAAALRSVLPPRRPVGTAA